MSRRHLSWEEFDGFGRATGSAFCEEGKNGGNLPSNDEKHKCCITRGEMGRVQPVLSGKEKECDSWVHGHMTEHINKGRRKRISLFKNQHTDEKSCRLYQGREGCWENPGGCFKGLFYGVKRGKDYCAASAEKKRGRRDHK